MLSSVSKNVSFALGFLCHYIVVVICCLPYWKVSNWQSSDGLYGRIPTFDGVWWHCMAPRDGGFTCNNYGKPSIYSSMAVQVPNSFINIFVMVSKSFYAVKDDGKDEGVHGGRGGAIFCLGFMWIMFYFLFWMTCFPDWTHSAWQLEDNLMGRVKRFNGLFLRCISPKQGAFKCDNYGKPTFVLSEGHQIMKSSGTPAPAAFGLWMFIVLNHIAILFVCVFPDWKHSSWQISNGLIGRVATFSGIWWNCFSPKWGLFVCDNHGQVPVYSKRLSFVGCLVVTAYPEWLRNSQQSSAEFLRNQYIYHGIWWRCSSVQVGIFQCDHYDASLLAIPTDIQACRALMCIATIFSFFGTLVALLSLDCTTLIEPESKSKNYSALGAGLCFVITAELQAQRALMVIAVVLTFIGLAIGMISLRCTTMIENELKRKSGIGIAAGICFLLAALSCGIAVSWFAWRITFEYYNVLYKEKEFKYEFGACLYVGWVATLLGACVLTTTIWFGVNVQRRYYDPAYKNDSFKYEYGSCLYVGWVAGFFTFVSGLVLTVGSCRSLNASDNDAYSPNKPYVYKPPTSSMAKTNGEKTEYV